MDSIFIENKISFAHRPQLDGIFVEQNVFKLVKLTLPISFRKLATVAILKKSN